MAAQQATTKARGFAIAEERTPPRRLQRAGLDVIEGIFQFETAVGRGFGVVRLLANEPSKAFQLMTSLHELKGFEEKIGKRRPTGEAFSRDFGGTNWKEYLPPRFQKVIFFPALYSKDELDNWGKNWVEKEVISKIQAAKHV